MTIDPRLLAALIAIARRGASSEADADVIATVERTMNGDTK